MTQAFRLLGDPRSYYVELPRYRKDTPAYKYVFRNNLRSAYLRHMARENPNLRLDDINDSPKRRFVALHHFHPAVVRAFYENPLTSAQKHKVPISITEHELKELDMEVLAEDQILSVSGMPTGGYYFVPSYPHEGAHDDLKVLIQAVRASRQQKKAALKTKHHRRREEENRSVPFNIEINTPHKGSSSPSDELKKKDDRCNGGLPKPPPKKEEGGAASASFESGAAVVVVVSSEAAVRKDDDDDDSSTEQDTTAGSRDVSGKSADSEAAIESSLEVVDREEGESEFDHIWNKKSSPAAATTSADRVMESDVLMNQTILEEVDGGGEGDTGGDAPNDSSEAESGKDVTPTSAASLASRRDADRPWATPKYRRARDKEKAQNVSGPADYIDPNETGDLGTRLASTPEVDDGDDIARIAAGMTVYQMDNDLLPSPEKSPKRKKSADPPGATAKQRAIQKQPSADEDSVDSGGVGAFVLTHQLPGTDPTLRIQVHNDLIAWESKRRSDLSQHMEYYREQWKAACEIITEGMAEARFAERLILGISKASRLFADSLRAVYDDKLVDDRGNTVKNSFLQNRLAKQRNAFEYSIENNASEDAGHIGQSMLLDSIVDVQLEIATAFNESSNHLDQEILPEILELTEELQRDSHGLESMGNSILNELKRSEIEVKSIWGE